MPGMDSSFVAALPALLLAAAAVLLAPPAMDAALRKDDGERLFWFGLSGMLTAVAAVAWAGLTSPAAAAVTGLCVLAGSAAAGLWLRKRQRDRRHARIQRLRTKELELLARRQEAILLEWSSYELDPWKEIEYPGIADVRISETSRLAGAVRQAEAAKQAVGMVPADDADALRRYAAAVDGLEGAWEAARSAARRRAGQPPGESA